MPPALLVPRRQRARLLGGESGVALLEDLGHHLGGLHPLLLHRAADLVLGHGRLALLDGVRVLALLARHLLVLPLLEVRLRVLLVHGPLPLEPGGLQGVQAPLLLLDHGLLLHQLVLQLLAQLLLHLELRGAVLVHLLHQLPAGELLLLPLVVALLPLPLRLLVLKPDELLLGLGLPGHLDLQRLREGACLLVGLLLLCLLDLRELPLPCDHFLNESLVELLLLALVRVAVCLLDSHVLIRFRALLLGSDLRLHQCFLFSLFLRRPNLLHLGGLFSLYHLFLLHALGLHAFLYL
mmetsp:Transcript_40761/g.109418  ORF Transcript_40761/g.109418 Transcript_40761/m.109418 type:complete len:294 (-) Transcript_40761:733-1614(-)